MKIIFKSFIALMIIFISTSKCLALDDVNVSKVIDSSGSDVDAHAGNIIFHDGYYYLIGEFRESKTPFTQKFSLYKSRDLKQWDFISIVYDQSSVNSLSNLERPKLIYNRKNNNFIIWYHEEFGKFFKNAKVAVAKSSKIGGPYKFVKSFRINSRSNPIYDDSEKYNDSLSKTADSIFKKDYYNGQMSRDMNIFKDDNGKGYLISSAENNKTIEISEMNDDYTDITGRYSRILVGRIREAPVLFKRNNIYYLFTSDVTGYHPNEIHLSCSDDIFKGWVEKNNPIVSNEDIDKKTTFNSQFSSVLHLTDSNDYIILADRWNTWKLYKSKYIWLKMHWDKNEPQVHWDLFNK